MIDTAEVCFVPTNRRHDIALHGIGRQGQSLPGNLGHLDIGGTGHFFFGFAAAGLATLGSM